MSLKAFSFFDKATPILNNTGAKRMKTIKILKFIGCLSLMLLCSLSFSQAALVNYGTYSYDTATGLDWLHLEQTEYKSWDWVYYRLNPGQIFEGWRFATGDEFNAMVTGMGGSPNDGGTGYAGWSTANNGVVAALLAHFGDLSEGNLNTRGILQGNPDRRNWPLAWLLDDPSYDESTTQDNITTYAGSIGTGAINSTTGSFLVRDSTHIPIPSSILLLASGLSILIWRCKNAKR
jgi:hypothetical protein